MHQFDLKNKTAVITGGAQGFGLDIAKKFLSSGSKVFIWDIDEKELLKATKEINSPNLEYNVIDVSNPDLIEKAITKKTKAIFLVHLLGNPCNMSKIKKIATKHNLLIIEDACEAHGAEFKNKKVGSFGNLATFSFFASHHITTMEGGMIVTNDETLAKKAKHLTTTAKVSHQWNYVHDEIGYNYRLANINAAIGLAQLENIEYFIENKVFVVMF